MSYRARRKLAVFLIENTGASTLWLVVTLVSVIGALAACWFG